jgi:DNA-binding response OmpR family regulator
MKKTIMIVEDEEMLRELLSTFLEEEGFQVYQAEDAEQAIQLFKDRPEEIKVVLTDMGLPRMGGWEMASELRSIKSDIRILFSSGYFDPQVRAKLITEGGVDFVQKPYVLENVVKTINAAFDKV